MPASTFRANYAALQQIAQTFTSQSDATAGMLKDLSQKMEDLRGGGWKGDSANKFYAEMDSAVLPKLQKLSNALAEAARVTQKISQVAKQAEGDASRVFVFDSEGGGDSSAADRQKTGSDGGSTAGAVVGGVLGFMVGGPLGAAAGAYAGYKLGDGVSNPFADDPRVAPVDAKMRQDKQAAIDEAIKQYGIDTSAAKSIKYSPNLGNDEGRTDPDGNILIGDRAFKSPAWLASSIGHETVHAQQLKNGSWDPAHSDEQSRNMNEAEAYKWEVDHAEQNGLSHAEAKTAAGRYQAHYNALNAANKARADAGNFRAA